MSSIGFGNEPIVPEPAWGLPTPNIDPSEWEEEEDEE